ncbi:hypothetical protein Neosp_015236 [[Neocosmospora] mangrovei]
MASPTSDKRISLKSLIPRSGHKVAGCVSHTDADDQLGGKVVTVTDPADGSIHLHWGHKGRKIEDGDEPKKLIFNTWDTKLRKGEFQRFEDEPSYIHKLGHYGYEVHHVKFEQVLRWYLDTFTLTTTDSIFNPKTGMDIMTFIHLDKGEQYVDHHNFFLASGEGTRRDVHHASFEVDDVDSELKGHNYLKKKGWSLVLGVGRHLLGSQICDYWFDNDGFVLEHYADGDMVNNKNPPQRIAAGPESVAIGALRSRLGSSRGDMRTWGFSPFSRKGAQAGRLLK